MNILKWIINFISSWTGAIIIVLLLVFFVGQGFIIPSRSMVGTLYEGDMIFVKKFSYGLTIPKIPWIEMPILPDFNKNRHLIEGDRPKRGDLVVFNPPGDDKTYYIKRNFAVGGDKIVFASDGMYLRPFEGDEYINTHFKDYETKIFFNEKYIKEPYSKQYNGIHYGEKNGRVMPFRSYVYMYDRAKSGINNDTPNGGGIAMEPRLDNNMELVFYREIEEDSFFMVGDNRDNSEDSRFWGVIDYSRIVGKPWFTYFSITLTDSIESEAQDEVNRYKVRWNRMFRNVDTLQGESKSFEGECRVYDDSFCKSKIIFYSTI